MHGVCLLRSNTYKELENISSLLAMLTVESSLYTQKGDRVAESKKRDGALEGDHITYINIFNRY